MTTTQPNTTRRELTFRARDTVLRGTLTVPPGAGPLPAALLVPGSGEVDRDSNHRKLPLGVTRHLAEALATAGIATLRYDKRGVGASGGDFWAAGLHDNIADARAGLEALRAEEAVDPERVLIIGHSEGAFIAAALAVDMPVAGVGLLSGSARSGEETSRWQVDAIAPTMPRVVHVVMKLLRTDFHRQQEKTFRKLRASTEDVLRIAGRPHNARWFREYLDFDMRAVLPRVTVPVLAVTGDKDLQVPPEDVQRIGQLVGGPFEGHVPADVNHILRHTPGPPTLKAYPRQSAEPLDPGTVRLITDWCRAVTGPHGA